MSRKVVLVRSKSDIFSFEQEVGAGISDDDCGATVKPIDDFIDSVGGLLVEVNAQDVLRFEYDDSDIYVCRDVIDDFLERLVTKI